MSEDAAKTPDGVVVTHPDMGIYLGECMGLGFWSKLDAAGQPAAVVFPDEATARRVIATWENNSDPEAYAYQPVMTTREKGFAHIEDLVRAGLGDMLGELDPTPETPSVPGAMH